MSYLLENSLSTGTIGQVERMLNMLDLRRGLGTALHQNHIESTDSIAQMALSQILLCQPDQLSLLPPIHRQERAAKCAGGSGFDFDEYQHATIVGHQIKFADRGPEIPLQNRVALLAQKPLGARFALLTELMARITHRRRTSHD
ncbi:MAG: hypothetical protein LZF86_190229 [Nitrospira sp.]|nr:MAG: hypothetical protein LZF86_190229 [Nitrospira sp.]